MWANRLIQKLVVKHFLEESFDYCTSLGISKRLCNQNKVMF